MTWERRASSGPTGKDLLGDLLTGGDSWALTRTGEPAGERASKALAPRGI
jgi:hypothetical protein